MGRRSGGLPARLADLAVHRRRRVLVVAVLAIVAGAALTPLFLSRLTGTGYDTPGTASYRADRAIARATGSSEQDVLVVSSSRYRVGSPMFDRALAGAEVVVRRATPGGVVLGPGSPGGGEVSPDREVATATFALGGSVAHRQATSGELQHQLRSTMPPGVEAAVTGDSPLLSDLLHTEDREVATAEAVGLPIAAVILLLAFGTVVAAGLPLLLGVSGVLVSFGVVAGLMEVEHFDVFVESLMTMFGLAIGIDYALLFVRRYREERALGDGTEAAMAHTLATAGRTILFSGTILSASLVPLALTDLPFFGDVALASIVVVVVEVVLLLTVLPAVLLTLGDRLDRLRVGARRLRRPEERGRGWYRWALGVMRRPVPVLLAGAAVLLVAASPALHLRTGIYLNASAMRDEPSVRALTVAERHLGSSSLGPVEVLVRSRRKEVAGATGRAAQVLRSQPDLLGAEAEAIGPGVALLVAQPTVAIDSRAADHLVTRIRGELRSAMGPGTSAVVTGTTAVDLDYSHRAGSVTPWVVAATLGLAFVLLLCLFRSPLLALKAIVLNLLTISAAIGLTVLVFQDGHGHGLLGFSPSGYLQSWLPLTMFVVLFGLSMDYEVFIVTRVREEWERTGDTTEAVARGLQRTGGVVTSAATIMVAIFASFLLVAIPEMKQMGFGLAVAVLIDATLVRAALVPAFMQVAGRANWWMPRWLDRVLPTVRHGG